MTEYISEQADLMRVTVGNLASNQSLLSKLASPNVSDYVNQIYKFEDIQNETLAYADRVEMFSEEFYDYDAGRYHYQIATIVSIPLLAVLAVVVYKLKKSWMILLISGVLFAFMVPCCLINGLNTSVFFLSIDFCMDVNKYITSGSNLYAGQGIGMYISCPSKSTQVKINTAKYELGNSFNQVFDDLNTTVRSLGGNKRNNLQFVYLAKNQYINDTAVSSQLYSLVYTNNILQGLNALSLCQCADSSINYLEEKFCYQNITLQFGTLIYYLIGIAGLFLLAVGSNKLIVLLNPAYQKLNHPGMELLSESAIN